MLWAALLVGLFCILMMLMDSFRPGRLTWPLAVGFVIALVALSALPSLPQLLAKSFKVPTAAMEPTLAGASNGIHDCVIVDRVSYLFCEPKRGELVVFRTTGLMGIQEEGSPMFVKRLVGLPGERIEIRDGRVFANEQLLNESDGIPPVTYIPAGLSVSPLKNASYTVPDGRFFFLGDNSAKSFDSRYWGSVPGKNIYGRVARIYYPFSRIGVPH